MSQTYKYEGTFLDGSFINKIDDDSFTHAYKVENSKGEIHMGLSLSEIEAMDMLNYFRDEFTIFAQVIVPSKHPQH